MKTQPNDDNQSRVTRLFPAKKLSWSNPDTSLLVGGAVTPPRFPSEMLGSFWAEWCEDLSASANAPVDYAAASLLTLAGTLIGNARTVKVGGWSEPPVLWSVLIGNPSSGKSPAMDPFMEMIVGFERQLAETTGQKIYIDDVSAQATAEVASRNPNGLLLFNEELSRWFTSFGQLGGEQFWLKAFGARPHTVIRKGKEPIHIPRLAVSVLGGTQPDTIRSFVEAKSNKGFASRWLYVFPAPKSGFSLAQATDHSKAEAALRRLLNLAEDGPTFACQLNQSALPHLEDWVGRKRAVAADEEGILGEWLGKQGGVALRIALILEHLWWAAEAPLGAAPPAEVEERAYRAATEFIDQYSAPMTERALDMAVRPKEDKAAIRLAKLLQKAGVSEFNARDVRRNALGPVGELAQSAVMSAACEVLETAHLIRNVGSRAGGTVGRLAANYEVNPVLLGRGPTPPPNNRGAGSLARRADSAAASKPTAPKSTGNVTLVSGEAPRLTAKSLDQYFTKAAVAEQCAEIILSLAPPDARFVEPSAGGGAFLPFLPADTIAFDIQPQHESVAVCDFLARSQVSRLFATLDNRPLVFAGNVPFGRRGTLARKFIVEALEYAELCGFIVPITFRKWMFQSQITKLAPNAKLISDTELDPRAFLFEGAQAPEYRCCFQVWTTGDTELPDLRLREKPKSGHSHFKIWQHNGENPAVLLNDWNIAVRRSGYGCYGQPIYDHADCDPKVHWMLMRAANPSVLRRLARLDYEALSKRSLRRPGFNMADVVEAYDAELRRERATAVTVHGNCRLGAKKPSKIQEQRHFKYLVHERERWAA